MTELEDIEFTGGIFFDLINTRWIESLEINEEDKRFVRQFEKKGGLRYVGTGSTTENGYKEPVYIFSDDREYVGFTIKGLKVSLKE